MAEVNPPLAVETGGEHAQQWRQAIAAVADDRVIGARGGTGVVGPLWEDGTEGDLSVTAKNNGTLTVVIDAGRCLIRGTENDAQGVYLCENDADVELVHDAAGVADRRDLIVARVRDHSVDAGGVTAWDLLIVKGVTLTLPAVPDSCIPLASVRVNTTTTQITGPGSGAGQVQDRRYHRLEATPQGFWTCHAFVNGDPVASGGFETLQLDTAQWDPSGMFDAPGIRTPAPGIYTVHATGRAGSTFAGFQTADMIVRKAGVVIAQTAQYQAALQWAAGVSREIDCAAGELIDLRLEHTSGGSENFTGRLSVSWQRPKPSGNVTLP